ncbi:hypothetical protein ACTG11_24800 [Aeromonas hydrophila]
MTNTFKWVIHTTKNARKLGCKKNSFNVNQKLPIELAIDNNYELELCEIIGGEERRYKKNALEITETDAYKLTKVDGKIKRKDPRQLLRRPIQMVIISDLERY